MRVVLPVRLLTKRDRLGSFQSLCGATLFYVSLSLTFFRPRKRRRLVKKGLGQEKMIRTLFSQLLLKMRSLMIRMMWGTPLLLPTFQNQCPMFLPMGVPDGGSPRGKRASCWEVGRLEVSMKASLGKIPLLLSLIIISKLFSL